MLYVSETKYNEQKNYANFCNPNERPDDFDRTCYVASYPLLLLKNMFIFDTKFYKIHLR